MATLKDQIDGVCKELKVTVKEGGLIAQVKAAAELCRAPAGTCPCSCADGFAQYCRFTGPHPCSCKVLKSNYKSNSYCKATHSHHCFCVEGKPDICREH